MNEDYLKAIEEAERAAKVDEKAPESEGDASSDDGKNGGGKSQPSHVKLVKAMSEMGFSIIDGMPCIPDGSGYRFGWDETHRAMLNVSPWSMDRSRNEAMRTLRYIAPELSAAPARYIAFKNCVLDVEGGKVHTLEDFRSLNKGLVPMAIPHNYNEDAERVEAVDKLLDGVSCGEREVRMNLEEIGGLALSRYSGDWNTAVWGYGTGANGKSTYLDSLRYMAGEKNTCDMTLDALEGDFNSQMLVGKSLWIADDLPATTVSKKTTAAVKKIVTGQPIKIEQKGKDPYQARMFCTIVATSNEPPSLADTSPGSLRRWHMVPFNADYRKHSEGRDIKMRDKLMNEAAAEYMIVLAIKGLRRVLENEGMTETTYSRTAQQELRERSNNVYAFLADHTREEILERPNVEVWYWMYQDETKARGGKPFDQSKFTNFINSEYGLTTANNGRYRNGDEYIGSGFADSYNNLARNHGRHAGDKYRVFIPKKSR